ncbi:proline-specific pep [Calocera viscosa TUFC12733]|uniref:Proline-specific pep n=1 Tax=Calocera viscosa (strain TUFC12733) TaxID=1330018 RepID=A0A167FU53_CALVF|nr:proline-specific pep [Calocera viscosa TUFC12733]
MVANYLLPISVLVEAHGIPVILYDQIGCSDSTHLPEKGGDFWTVELFLKELENLLEKLEIKEYDLLGTSWGAMLAAEHALLHLHSLWKLILSNGLTSMKMWEDSVISLLKTMPQDVQDTIKKHEKEHNYNTPEYRAACKVFYDVHLCRIIPTPPELVEAYTHMIQQSGPSEFHSLGTLKTWNIISRLGEITTPTLVLNGKYDMTSDMVVKPFLDGIKGSKWVRFEYSSHAPMLEEREKYAEVVGEFLTE